jgi:hypothetical protein
MRIRTRILATVSFASVGLLAFGYSVAQAQDGAPPATEAPLTGTLSGNVNLSPEQMLEQADSALRRMGSNAMQVQQMLDKADQQGDATKVDCLNNELNIIHTRLRAAKDRKAMLDGALRAQDTGQAFVFLLVIENHRDEAAHARFRADSCIGSEASFIGDSSSSTTVDPDIPEENPQSPPILDIPGWGLDLPPGTDPSASL